MTSTERLTDEWDYATPTHHEPTKSPRAVVSVAFSRAEFDAVTAEAQRRGMKLSAYIRETTLRCQPTRPAVSISHSLGGIITGTRTLATRVRILRRQP